MQHESEASLVQKLASNEKSVRDQAIKKLRRQLTARSAKGIEESTFLKFWKGLHYCMWMSDKPLVQEDLAKNIAGLVHCLSKYNQKMAFLRQYLLTEIREWNGIDFLRVDKFMTMFRFIIVEYLAILENCNWQLEFVKSFINTCFNCLFPSNRNSAEDLQQHFIFLWIDELKKFGHSISAECCRWMFLQFARLMAEKSRTNDRLFRFIEEKVFRELCSTYILFEGQSERSVAQLPINFNRLADDIFQFASAPDSDLKRNRRSSLYRIVRWLRKLAKGEYPFSDLNAIDEASQMAEWGHLDRPDVLDLETPGVKTSNRWSRVRLPAGLQAEDVEKAAAELLVEDTKIIKDKLNNKRRAKKLKQRPEEDPDNAIQSPFPEIDFDINDEARSPLLKGAKLNTKAGKKRKALFTNGVSDGGLPLKMAKSSYGKKTKKIGQQSLEVTKRKVVKNMKKLEKQTAAQKLSTSKEKRQKKKVKTVLKTAPKTTAEAVSKRTDKTARKTLSKKTAKTIGSTNKQNPAAKKRVSFGQTHVFTKIPSVNSPAMPSPKSILKNREPTPVRRSRQAKARQARKQRLKAAKRR